MLDIHTYIVRVLNVSIRLPLQFLHFILLPQKVDGLYALNENLKVFCVHFLYDL